MKEKAYKVLAKDRYAKCPEGMNPRVFAAVRGVMERRFTQAYMDTPEGLYTDAQIWAQCFNKYNK